MTTRHLVDPQLLPLLESFPTLQLTRAAVPLMRAVGVTRLAALKLPPDPAVAVSEERIPGPPGAPDVRVMVFTPVGISSARSAILHMHGGGYFLGSPDLGASRNTSIVKEVGCVIVSVDYRLAPETIHPGPVEDCYAALKWLHTNAERLGVDRTRIAVAGESAGGGLSAALALLTRDRDEITLAFQALLGPMLDDRTASSTAQRHPFAGEFIWTYESNRFGWSCLLGCEPGSAGISPYAAAARAENLSGLPPTYISTSALDMLVEENVEYARRLMRAGVPTELHLYPGAVHGFEMAPDADVARQAHRDLCSALRRALRGA